VEPIKIDCKHTVTAVMDFIDNNHDKVTEERNFYQFNDALVSISRECPNLFLGVRKSLSRHPEIHNGWRSDFYYEGYDLLKGEDLYVVSILN